MPESKPKLTPEALHRFFEALAPEEGDEAQKCSMHYGCPCIVEHGRQAARMLYEIQKTLGIDPAPAAVAQPAPAAPAPSKGPSPAEQTMTAKLAEIGAALETERKKSAALKEQTAKLAGESGRLRDHIRLLQRQLDRLHDRRELSSVLNRIEGGRDGESPLPPPSPAAEAPAETAPPTPDSPKDTLPPARGKRPPSTLAETIEMEGAMPHREEPAIGDVESGEDPKSV